jgi:integrase
MGVTTVARVYEREWTSRKTGETKTAYAVDYFDGKGKRRQRQFAKKRDANAYLIKVQHEVSEGTHVAPRESIDVAEAADRWLDNCKRLKKLERSTTLQYHIHIEHHIKPLIGHIKLANLSSPDVDKFANDLIDRPSRGYGGYGKNKTAISRVTAVKILTSLKSLLRLARRQGMLNKDPAGPVSIELSERGTGIRSGRDFPSPAEINRLLAKAEGPFRPLLVVAIFTGMRSSELRGLTWENVDFDERKIHVVERADAWGKMGAPKSKKGTRTIPMTPMVLTTLREWKLACPNGELRLVFPNREGRVANHPNLVSRVWRPLQQAAGVVDKAGRPKYGIHSLRHFFASWLINRPDFSPKEVQELLGHSSIKMTYDVYGHLFPQLKDDHAKFAAAELALVE